jgi:hypothetical protein
MRRNQARPQRKESAIAGLKLQNINVRLGKRLHDMGFCLYVNDVATCMICWECVRLGTRADAEVIARAKSHMARCLHDINTGAGAVG